MPLSRTFTQGGTVPKPVIVVFQGEWIGFREGVIVTMRLVIDTVAQEPGSVIMNHRPPGEPVVLGTHGFNFISSPLAPGPHNATIQWRDNGAGQGCIQNRSMIILHK